jgi:hypothetical protein
MTLQAGELLFPSPAQASTLFLMAVGLNTERFRKWLKSGTHQREDWHSVAHEYFLGYECHEGFTDDAEQDFVLMGFTLESARAAAALYGSDYGHKCPWEWAPGHLLAAVRNAKKTMAAS